MVSKELLTFITDFFNERNISVNVNNLNRKTEIYYDLGVSELDVDVFMAEFLKKFDVDDSNFDRKKYFGIGIPLIDNNVKTIKKILGNRKWLPMEKEKREPFTLEVLDKAIRTEKLE